MGATEAAVGKRPPVRVADSGRRAPFRGVMGGSDPVRHRDGGAPLQAVGFVGAGWRPGVAVSLFSQPGRHHG